MKILMQAEAFGMGPSSIVATLSKQLKLDGHTLDFVKFGFTHLIQDKLIINKFINPDRLYKNPQKILDQYDLVLIALDWNFAKHVVKYHDNVHFIDALTWFWDYVPEVYKQFKGYYSIKFIDIPTRFNNMVANNINCHQVPPFQSQKTFELERTGTMISFGGITNPKFHVDTPKTFADAVIASICKTKNKQTIVGNSKLNKKIQSVTTTQFQELMITSKAFVGTSGLGHIQDLIYTRTPALFLPPCNDSQYLQSTYLPGVTGAWQYVHWHDFGDDYVIDFTRDQTDIIEQIQTNIIKFSDDPTAQFYLSYRMEQFKVHSLKYYEHEYCHVADIWGYDGDRLVADLITK